MLPSMLPEKVTRSQTRQNKAHFNRVVAADPGGGAYHVEGISASSIDSFQNHALYENTIVTDRPPF